MNRSGLSILAHRDIVLFFVSRTENVEHFRQVAKRWVEMALQPMAQSRKHRRLLWAPDYPFPSELPASNS